MTEIDHKNNKIQKLEDEIQSITNGLEISNNTLKMVENKNNELVSKLKLMEND